MKPLTTIVRLVVPIKILPRDARAAAESRTLVVLKCALS